MTNKSDSAIASWHKAARAENVDHIIGTVAAFSQCRGTLESMLKVLDLERAKLRYLGQRCSDHYWLHNHAHRTKDTPGYPWHHGCRVRLVKSSLEMHWYYNTFVKKEEGEGYKVFSKHICRELKHRYSKTSFNRAQYYERPIINQTEAGFELIRIMNANLSAMRRMIKMNLKTLDKLEEHINTFENPITK